MADGHAKVKIPESISKYIQRGATKETKMMAAKSIIPMAPLVQITVLTFLLGDPDQEIVTEAKNSLISIPSNILKGLLKEAIHPNALQFYAENKSENTELMEPLVLNKLTPDNAFIYLADKASGKVLDIIGSNQQRMLRTPDIANNFKKNTNASKAAIDRVVSFLRMNGITIEGESSVLTPKEINSLVNETLKQAPKGVDPSTIQNLKQVQQMTMAMAGDGLSDDDDDDEFLDADSGLVDDDMSDEDFGESFDLFNEEESKSEEEKRDMAAKLADMNIPQKVKLALLGSKEVRTLLIKDRNKVVSSAVIKSPKITESEILSISQMRSVNDEIIRYIASNNDWVKKYSIKHALANNPKTPIPISLKFMRYLNAKDISDLSKNKNVSPQVQKIAKQQFNKMRGMD